MALTFQFWKGYFNPILSKVWTVDSFFGIININIFYILNLLFNFFELEETITDSSNGIIFTLNVFYEVL